MVEVGPHDFLGNFPEPLARLSVTPPHHNAHISARSPPSQEGVPRQAPFSFVLGYSRELAQIRCWPHKLFAFRHEAEPGTFLH